MEGNLLIGFHFFMGRSKGGKSSREVFHWVVVKKFPWLNPLSQRPDNHQWLNFRLTCVNAPNITLYSPPLNPKPFHYLKQTVTNLLPPHSSLLAIVDCIHHQLEKSAKCSHTAPPLSEVSAGKKQPARFIPTAAATAADGFLVVVASTKQRWLGCVILLERVRTT